MTAPTVKQFMLPDLGEGLTEAALVQWRVEVGDHVNLNDVLCSVETAKAEVELPSPFAGRVSRRHGTEGDVLEVGSVLVEIDIAPASPAAPRTNGSQPPACDSAPPTTASVLVGYGADATADTSRRRGGHRGRSGRGRAPVAPPARKLAAELRLDLTDVKPGLSGVITREDVLAAAAVAGRDEADGKPGRGYDILPVNRVQLRMAERMSKSRAEIPDAHASVAVDCTSLVALRDRFRSTVAEDGPRITTFVLAMRLLVVTLGHNKIFNSSWSDTPNGPQIHVHRSVHLGFGVATDRGLVVPVVADAQDKTTLALAARVTELVRGAREGTLKPTELQGSTFTVSNFGALGLDEGVPVINYPEAAILGIGSLKSQYVVIDGEPVIRPMMTITCAFDHRIADGAQVAKFLCEIRDLIESPEMALLDL